MIASSFQGELIAIFIGPHKAGLMQRVDEVRAIAGKGLEGDRFAALDDRRRKPENEVTLIESEALEATARDYQITLDPSQTRRNLLTHGVPLNHLVGREFTVGQITLRGIELCEPCGHLEKLTANGVKNALRHRGGLRAQVVRAGVVRTGDAIAPAQLAGD